MALESSTGSSYSSTASKEPSAKYIRSSGGGESAMSGMRLGSLCRITWIRIGFKHVSLKNASTYWSDWSLVASGMILGVMALSRAPKIALTVCPAGTFCRILSTTSCSVADFMTATHWEGPPSHL